MSSFVLHLSLFPPFLFWKITVQLNSHGALYSSILPQSARLPLRLSISPTLNCSFVFGNLEAVCAQQVEKLFRPISIAAYEQKSPTIQAAHTAEAQ